VSCLRAEGTLYGNCKQMAFINFRQTFFGFIIFCCLLILRFGRNVWKRFKCCLVQTRISALQTLIDQFSWSCAWTVSRMRPLHLRSFLSVGYQQHQHGGGAYMWDAFRLEAVHTELNAQIYGIVPEDKNSKIINCFYHYSCNLAFGIWKFVQVLW
jgi:hypothetical protein